MGKSNGSTRSSNSGNPRGLTETPAIQAVNARAREAQQEIADLEESISELESQKEELFQETDRLGKEMVQDRRNEEYYQNQIMDMDREIDALDHEIELTRIRIDRLRRNNNL